MTAKTGLAGGTSSAEGKAIRQTVLNYLEAWYRGEPERGGRESSP